MPIVGSSGQTGKLGANSGAVGNTGAAGAVPSPVTGAIAQGLASPTWRAQIGAYLYGGYAGELGTYGLQGAVANQALGTTAAGLAATAAFLQNQAGFTFARAMLGEQTLGIRSGTLARQAGTAAGQQAIEQQQYGTTIGRYLVQAETATLSEANRQLGLQSEAAGRGTLGTEGSKIAQSTAAEQYRWQMATIYRAQQLAALGQQSEQLGYKTRAAAFAAGQAQLGIAAKQAGVGVETAVSRLGWGLSQLGVKATPAQLLQGIATSQTGAATALRALLSSGALIGGLGPNFAQPSGG